MSFLSHIIREREGEGGDSTDVRLAKPIKELEFDADSFKQRESQTGKSVVSR